ncbi:MAG TPA: STAS domain-containing protein [Candidatus Acidoferrum sp.]|jgi:anti-anti-sigma factor|nr:STAS domain-containing protein [Candidatus Acidoferrum sp.]
MSAFTLFPRYVRFPCYVRPPERSGEDASIDYLPGNYPAIEAAVDAKLEHGAEQVVLDLDTLVVLDTEALRDLIALLRRARLKGAQIALRSSRDAILRTLSVTGLDRVFALV